jgi:hypothetical protein
MVKSPPHRSRVSLSKPPESASPLQAKKVSRASAGKIMPMTRSCMKSLNLRLPARKRGSGVTVTRTSPLAVHVNGKPRSRSIQPPEPSARRLEVVSPRSTSYCPEKKGLILRALCVLSGEEMIPSGTGARNNVGLGPPRWRTCRPHRREPCPGTTSDPVTVTRTPGISSARGLARRSDGVHSLAACSP